MTLYMRHSVLTAPPPGQPGGPGIGLPAPPPGAGLLPGITRTAYTGSTTISTAGAIIRDKNITNGGLTVTANNVQIINCSFVTGTSSFPWIISCEGNGTIVDHCFVNAGLLGVANSCIGAWSNTTVTNCSLTGAENGIMFSSGALLQGNYLYSLGGGPEAHVDGMQTTACSNVRIVGNWIEAWDTSGVFLKADDGAINTVLVDGNTLISDPAHPLGPSAPIYAYSVGANLCTNVTISNNRIQVGAYGSYVFTQNSSPVLSGNVDYFTGAAI